MVALYKKIKKLIELDKLDKIPELFKCNSIDVTDDSGYTALHYAVKENRVDIVTILLANHADINIAGQFGWTPLHIAGNKKLFHLSNILLQNGADKEIFDSDGNQPDVNDDSKVAECVLCNAREHGNYYSYVIITEEHIHSGPETKSTWKKYATGSGFICKNCAKDEYWNYNLWSEILYFACYLLIVGLLIIPIPVKENSDYYIMIFVLLLWLLLSRALFQRIKENKNNYLQIQAGKASKLNQFKGLHGAKAISIRRDWQIFKKGQM